jgi:3-oxoacyl-[acyl-carrier-protein] synthase II
MNRVVITGLGAITPLGHDTKETWVNLLAGKSGIDLIKAFDTSKHTVKIAGEIPDFQPEIRVEPKPLKRLDRCVQLSLWATIEAVEDAEIDFTQYDRGRIGVIIGSGIGGLSTWEREFTKFMKGGPARVSPFLIPMMIPDMTAGYVAIHYGLGGPNYSTVSACASGAHAIGVAFRTIKYGDAEVMVAGGAEAPVTPFALAGFSNMRALSRRNDAPQKASRPFDKARDGFVMSEGAATLILEDEAGCVKEDIDYLNTHGTSTGLNDKFEIIATKDLFGTYAKDLIINATKSMLGHTLGAAGAIEAMAVLFSIRDNVIHQSINLEDPLDEADGLDIVIGESRKAVVDYALSNSLGFGGHNATLCFKRYAA